MRSVDLNAYRFDYDLTFAVLLMNADGTTYHRYGGRDELDSSTRLSMASLVKLLTDGLEDHAAYQKDPKPPEPLPKKVVEKLPPMANRRGCFHCHMVNDADRQMAQDEKQWTVDQVWRFPRPEKVGITVSVDDPALVLTVARGSPADKAGLKAKDRLLSLAGDRVRSEADIQWALDRAPLSATKTTLEFESSGEKKTGTLSLEDGWKRADPFAVAWRPSLWSLRPQPGFGGRALVESEKEKLGLDAFAFAFLVSYVNAENATKAGIKRGDVFLSAAGKNNFRSERDFQAWFRITRKPGTSVEIVLLREGARETVTLPVP